MARFVRAEWADNAIAYATMKVQTARNTQSYFLDLSSRKSLQKIPDLSALPFVRAINFEGTKISDISPLTDLDDLRSLNLHDTLVADIDVLAKFVNLQKLIIWNTRVSHLGALAQLTDLNELDAMNSKVSDIEPIASLSKLKTLDLMGMRVATLESLRSLTQLENLRLGSSQITDLAPITSLKSLKSLSIRNTQISNLSPLANLENLTYLDITGTAVTDLSPLRDLHKLRNLEAAHTKITDIGPLSKLKELRTFELSSGQTVDIGPLEDLSKLVAMRLSAITIRNAGTMAKLTGLVEGAKMSPAGQGLQITRCKTGDAALDELFKLENPERTVRAVNYLRNQASLEPYVAADASNSSEKLVEALKEDPLGARAVLARDEFELILDQDSKLLEDQDSAEQAHKEVIRKAKALEEDCQGIGNQPGWKRLSETTELFLEELDRPFEELVSRSVTLWSLSSSLGSFLEQNREAKSNRDSMVLPLEPNVERSLADVVLIGARFVRMFDAPRILDAGLVDFSSQKASVTAALEIATRAGHGHVLRDRDASALASALSSSSYDGAFTRKAHGFGLKTVMNFVAAAVAFIYGGGPQKIAEKFVEQSNLVGRATNFLLDSETDVLRVYEEASPDIREAMRELIVRARGRQRARQPKA
jgi:Leucine-rich repeat (LRR) protein